MGKKVYYKKKRLVIDYLMEKVTFQRNQEVCLLELCVKSEVY